METTWDALVRLRNDRSLGESALKEANLILQKLSTASIESTIETEANAFVRQHTLPMNVMLAEAA